MGPKDWRRKRETIRHYNGLVSVYDSLYEEEQRLKAESALKEVEVRRRDLVLDVGCGTGLLIGHIGDSANLLVGVDASLGLLKVAANRSKSLRTTSSVSLVCADAEHMPVRKAVFDKVFALTLLQNVSDPDAALKEMMRVSKKGSTVVVTALKKSFSEERFKNILDKAGLDFCVTRTNERTRDFVAVCCGKP